MRGGDIMAREKPKNKAEPNKGGRPPYYTTKEEMQVLIDKYFEESKGKMLLDAEDNPVLNKGYPIFIDAYPLTITGLALALGFTSRQSLLNYQDKPEFVDTLTRAKLKIEEYANQRLYDRDGVQGAKFTLINNYTGYADKQDIEHSGGLDIKVEWD